MAKKTVARRGIKNAHMIGAGAKFTPVYSNKGVVNWRGSVMKQGRSQTLPSMPKTASKKPIRQVSTSFKLSSKSYKAQPSKPMVVKVPDKNVRFKGLQQMKKQIAKTTPSPKVQIKTKAKAIIKKPKPPSRGR